MEKMRRLVIEATKTVVVMDSLSEDMMTLDGVRSRDSGINTLWSVCKHTEKLLTFQISFKVGPF